MNHNSYTILSFTSIYTCTFMRINCRYKHCMDGWLKFWTLLKLLFKNFWNFSVHNLAPEDISVVAGVGDSITVCTEYRITKALHASSFDTFYIFWYILYKVRNELILTWPYLTLTCPWPDLDGYVTSVLLMVFDWFQAGTGIQAKTIIGLLTEYRGLSWR